MEIWKIVLEIFLIFRKSKLFSTNLEEQIIHYITTTYKIIIYSQASRRSATSRDKVKDNLFVTRRANSFWPNMKLTILIQ